MTRSFGQTIHCSYCGKETTQETAFARWVRNEPELYSHLGYCFSDIDVNSFLYIVHKYRTQHEREIQYLMMLEVKIFSGDVKESQRETISFISQIFRNRKETPTKKNNRRQLNPTINKLYSTLSKRFIIPKLFGFHLLQFSETGPEDSNLIKWDHIWTISKEKLIKLLKFELDPDTLKPMDLRIHHKPEIFPLFPKFP